jgi:hypothetical protein
MLSHHGMLVAGDGVEQPCVLAIAFEHASRLQLRAMPAGGIKPVDLQKGREAHGWMTMTSTQTSSSAITRDACSNDIPIPCRSAVAPPFTSSQSRQVRAGL